MPPNLARFSKGPEVGQRCAIEFEEGDPMAENREIDDDELVEIIGAGEFDVFDDEMGGRPSPGSDDSTNETDSDNRPGGDQEFGE